MRFTLGDPPSVPVNRLFRVGPRRPKPPSRKGAAPRFPVPPDAREVFFPERDRSGALTGPEPSVPEVILGNARLRKGDRKRMRRGLAAKEIERRAVLRLAAAFIPAVEREGFDRRVAEEVAIRAARRAVRDAAWIVESLRERWPRVNWTKWRAP